jgi:hypothetical protein
MNRLSTIALAFSLFVVACGSDVTMEPDQQLNEPTVEPTAPPTSEPPLGGGPYPIAAIDFVVTDTESGEQTAMYSLSCLGDTATLTGDWSPIDDGGLGTADDRMCRLLGESGVQSRLVDGVATDLACTEIYGSADFAAVTGELDAQPVSTSFDRANGCGISDWDDVMEGLLPVPAKA